MSEPVRITLAVVVFVVLIGIFALTYFLNHKTPAPKGMENLKVDESMCKGCQIAGSCELRKTAKQEECKQEEKPEDKTSHDSTEENK